MVDKNGNWFLDPKFRKAWRSGRYIIIGQKGKWAIIDALNGEWLDDVEDYYYDNVEDSLEYGALKLIKKRKDREEIEYLFDNGDCYDKNTADIFIENEEELEMISDEEDIEEDIENEEEISDYKKVIYEKITPQKDDNGKWGYVNENGEWMIPAQYDLAKAFVNGTAIVKVEDKYGIIMPDGSYALEPELDDAWSWEEFIIARQGENDEWGVMDRFGEWICGGNLRTIEGPTIRLKDPNIITHDYLDLWDDNGDGNKLFSGEIFEEIDNYRFYYEGFEEDED